MNFFKSKDIDPQLKSELHAKGVLVSDCMLSQMLFTTVGVGVGLAIGLQKKSLRSFVIWASIGTVGDLIYGYNGPCKDHIKEFQMCQTKINLASSTTENIDPKQ